MSGDLGPLAGNIAGPTADLLLEGVGLALAK